MLTFLLTLALMLLLLSDGAASNARILEYKGCPIPIAANATNATIATSATISCRLPHSSVQHYGRIQGPDQSQREGEREGRSPHPGKNAIFIATLQTMVVVRLANLLHPSPTP